VETGHSVLQAEDKMDDGTSIKLKIEISDKVCTVYKFEMSAQP